jgi:hypothetical protein
MQQRATARAQRRVPVFRQKAAARNGTLIVRRN